MFGFIGPGRFWATIGLVLLGTSLLSTAKGQQPSVFAPGVISGSASVTAPAFTSDGRTVYFTLSNGANNVIVFSRLTAGRWSRPTIAPFSGQWRDLEAALSPDGSFLVFASNRPATAGGKPLDAFYGGKLSPGMGGNLWRAARRGATWGEPVRLPDTVNSSSTVFSPSIAGDGSIYFMKASDETGRFQIYRSQLKGGEYQAPELMSYSNPAWNNVDPSVAPDESFAVFSSNRPPVAAGDLDMFIVFRKAGRWGEPIHLGGEINSPTSEIEPRLGPDGRTLYFSSRRLIPVTYPVAASERLALLKRTQAWENGLNKIWRVDLSSWLNSDGARSAPPTVDAMAVDARLAPIGAVASDYLSPKLQIGEKLNNIFSRTIAYSGDGISELAQRVSGTANYIVKDNAPAKIVLDGVFHYDGRPLTSGPTEFRDGDRTICYKGKCTLDTSASGVLFNPYLWGDPTRKIAVGASWEVTLTEAWELGPPGKQIVTVIAIDPANHTITLKREGRAEGFTDSDAKQIQIKKDNQPYTVNVEPGESHWVGYTTFRAGIVISDELLVERPVTLTSKELGSIAGHERQYILLNAMP